MSCSRFWRHLPLAAAALVVFAAAPFVVDAQQIIKCQDAEGRWHYGQFAAQECESAATRIDARGVRRGAIAAPPSAEELEAQRRIEALAEQEAQRQADERAAEERLLRIYLNEEEIQRARDDRLAAIDADIRLSEDFLGRLDDRLAGLERELEEDNLSAADRERVEDEIQHADAQIARFRDAIAESLGQRRDIEQRYDDDLRAFRAIMERRADRQVQE